MLLWLLCVAASLLSAAETKSVKPRVPAALNLQSSADTMQCGVTYLVLHAATDAACLQLCQLLLSQPDKHKLQNTDEPGEPSAGIELHSPLLVTNVVSLPQSRDSREYYLLEVVCQTSNNCIASPHSWDILKEPSTLQVVPQQPTSRAAEQTTVMRGCVHEINTTVTHTISSEDVTQSRAGLDSPPHTWAVRTALLVCLIILQRTASHL